MSQTITSSAYIPVYTSDENSTLQVNLEIPGVGTETSDMGTFATCDVRTLCAILELAENRLRAVKALDCIYGLERREHLSRCEGAIDMAGSAVYGVMASATVSNSLFGAVVGTVKRLEKEIGRFLLLRKQGRLPVPTHEEDREDPSGIEHFFGRIEELATLPETF